MAKIYIADSSVETEKDRRLRKELSSRLVSLGHEILNFDEAGTDIELNLKRGLSNADVFLAFISESSFRSKIFYDELLQLRNYSVHSNNRLFLPIFWPDLNLDDVPQSIASIQGIRISNPTLEEIFIAAARIDEAINLFLGKKIATNEKAQEIKKKIESSAPKYITETISELTKREKYLKTVALLWYIIGFIALLIGVGVAVWFSNNGIVTLAGKENWSITIFYAIKSVFIIVLLIAASKYSFNLAKSYMSESLKIADRIHAISFGKFYLQVFNQQVEPTEIKEIFRDWNINNQTNTFSSQQSNDYDPKLIEKISELVEKIKGDSKDK